MIQEIVNMAANPPQVPDVAPEDREFIISKGFDFQKYKQGYASLTVTEADQERAERIMKGFDSDKFMLFVLKIIDN